MKFSVIYEAQTTDASRHGDRKVYEELVDQVILAEQCGFDTVWCVEHTALSYYAHMSAPETFLAYIAGRTTRIGIGHGVVCLPPAMNHPIKVAERIATLDILSKGRVHFGVGKGGSQQEAGAFGYKLEELQPMIDESMYLIPRFFVEDVVEHNGKYLQIPPRPVHPKPYQDPHPPMYMACTREESLATAGDRGLGALVLGFGGPPDIEKKNKIYREHWKNRDPAKQVGFNPINHLAALCPAVVLEDKARARKFGDRGMRFFVESLAHWYTGEPLPQPETWGDDPLGEAREMKTKFASESITLSPRRQSETMLEGGEQAIGDPRHCIEYCERLIAAGADEILFMWNLGTVPQWAQLETIQNIGRYVIPYFRARGI